MKIGRRLLKPEARSDRRLIGSLAQWLEVTPKTLRSWRSLAEKQSPKRIGRPRYSADLRQHALEQIEAELVRQSYPGWRPIARALPSLPTRLVQECVATIKRAKRKRTRVARQEQRVTTRVLARDAIWTMDGTRVGRDETGKPIEAQVVKDRASLAYRAVQSGPTAKSTEVAEVLQTIKTLPLVLATDNGSIYCSQQTQSYLARHKVIHLRSLPHTPEHNGAVEVSIRALKEAAQLSGQSLEVSAQQINKNRLCGTKEFKSPHCLDEELVVAYNKVNRDEFYERCSERLRRVASSTLHKRDKRRAEREVIFRTLEEYKLIERVRGNRPYECKNVEVFL